MRNTLLSLAVLTGLSGAGVTAAAAAPHSGIAPATQPLLQDVQYYGGPVQYYGGGPGWREREWRRREWERHRRWEEFHHWHHPRPEW